jgi:hypothetical protein
MNTRTTVALCLCLCICKYSFTQTYFYNNQYYDQDFLFEMNASAGAMNCLTDIGGRKGLGKGFLKDFSVLNTKLCGGISGGMVYRYMLGLKLDLNLGSIAASDGVLHNDETEGRHRYKRNLSFRSSIAECTLLGEIYPLVWVYYSKRFLLSPYITGGIGFFYFKPQAAINGVWVDLKPLRTEGQGFTEYPDHLPYRLTQINFPLGTGIKYDVSATTSVRFEVLYRLTTTDYLDDVSTSYIDPALFQKYLSPADAELALQLNDRQRELDPSHITAPGSIRGRSSKNDGYFSVQLKLGVILGRKRR